LVAEFIGIFTDKRKIRAAMHVFLFLARRDWCWQPGQGAALYTRPVHRGPALPPSSSPTLSAMSRARRPRPNRHS